MLSKRILLLAFVALSCMTYMAVADPTSDMSLSAHQAVDDALASKIAAGNEQSGSLRAKRSGGNRFTTQQIIEVLLCIFLPPVAVLIHGGNEMVIHLIINIILWILGWLPGTIHAVWYCFYR